MARSGIVVGGDLLIQRAGARRQGARWADSEMPISPKARKVRLLCIASVAIAWASVVVFHLYTMQIADFGRWQEWALKQHFTEVELASERGPIYDRNGRIMAISVPAGSVYLRPRQIKDRAAALNALTTTLHLKREFVAKKLQDPRPFVWLKRQLPRAVAESVSALGIAGVGHVLESKRVYPYNQAASTLLGRVGVDGIGLSGLESMYERQLHGAQLRTRAVRDALGNLIQANVEREFSLPKGASLNLTLDAGLQMIADEELARAQEEFHAKQLMAVMVDADTGEILVLSQSPSPNFNLTKTHNKDDLRNLVIESVFEPGSVMKPIVAAAALELGIANPSEVINCQNGRMPFGRHVIRDAHPFSDLSFFDVVVRSSNIGMAKIGLRVGKERLYPYLRQFGFGQPSGLELPGDTRGILRPPEEWSAIDVATHSFGHGVAVTPLQVVRAISAIANGGKLPTLRLVNDGTGITLQPLISEHTAQTVREMMYGVVESHEGTGRKAAIEGVRVGGKTGTAQKPWEHGRGYKPGAYVASFVGFVDASSLGVKKTYTLMVTVDEAHTSSIYGGTLAAPVFQRIMQRSLHFILSGDGLDSRARAEPRLQPARHGGEGTKAVDTIRRISA